MSGGPLIKVDVTKPATVLHIFCFLFLTPLAFGHRMHILMYTYRNRCVYSGSRSLIIQFPNSITRMIALPLRAAPVQNRIRVQPVPLGITHRLPKPGGRILATYGKGQ